MENRSSTKLKRKEVASAANPARVYWTREHDRVLVDLMLQQTLVGRSGSGFTRDAWLDMVYRFNERTGLHYDVDHLKNRLRFYKREYRVVKDIRNHEGFSWDHKLHVVVADDDEWNQYVAQNPEAKLYRTRQTPFFNELEIICTSSILKGNDASSCGIQDVERNNTNGNLGEGDGTLNSFVETPETSNDPIATSTDLHAEVPQDGHEAGNVDTRGASPLNISRRNSRRSRRRSDDALLALREIAEASKRRVTLREEVKDGKYSLLDDCLEELHLMKDIDNELFVKALFIFKEEYNQHIFLKTTGTRRMMWLRAVTKDIILE